MSFNKILCVCVLVSVGSAQSDIGHVINSRSDQLMTIVDGLQQLVSLLHDSWQTGARAARALTLNMNTQQMARAMQDSDPIEALVSKLQLDKGRCSERLVCELHSRLTAYSAGDLVYEFLKRKVPKLKKYTVTVPGGVTSSGASKCHVMYPCRLSNSPLMASARHLRALVENFCDPSTASYTGQFCLAVKKSVDKLEEL